MLNHSWICGPGQVETVAGVHDRRTFSIEAKRREMSKQAIREEIERLVKEALERKTVSVKQGQTRIEAKCGKCGALNSVLAPPGQVRVQYKCKECGEKQKTL